MFVSRARYDAMQRRAENAEAREAVLLSLVDKLATPAPPEAKPEPVVTYESSPLPAVVRDAIDDLHLTEGERMKLAGWARRQLGEGKKADLIADTLRYGEDR